MTFATRKRRRTWQALAAGSLALGMVLFVPRAHAQQVRPANSAEAAGPAYDSAQDRAQASPAPERQPTRPPPPDAADQRLPPQSAPPGHKRPVPDYDGRPEPVGDLRQALLWVPRTLFFPYHFLTESLIRRPLVGFISWTEEHRALQRIKGALTWNGGRSGIYPMLRLDRGINGTFGFTFFTEDFLRPGNDVRLSAFSGANNIYRVSGGTRTAIFPGDAGQLRLQASYGRRPDEVFYGTGATTDEEDKTFFTARTLDVTAGLKGMLGDLDELRVDLSFRRARFAGSDIGDDSPSLTARFGGPEQPPLPPGFVDGYSLLLSQVRLILDSRQRLDESHSGSGVRFQGTGSLGTDPGDADLAFFRWGGELAGFFDLTGRRHTIGARVAVFFVENLASEPVPFTELVTLGGDEYMRGFLAGRLRGPSAFETTLQYRYPIWAFSDAELFTSFGNTFDGHLSGWSPDSLFWNYGLSIRTSLSRATSIGLTLAFASSRLDTADFDPIDFVRLFLGVNQGF